jgi:hypothetical protein
MVKEGKLGPSTDGFLKDAKVQVREFEDDIESFAAGRDIMKTFLK